MDLIKLKSTWLCPVKRASFKPKQDIKMQVATPNQAQLRQFLKHLRFNQCNLYANKKENRINTQKNNLCLDIFGFY